MLSLATNRLTSHIFLIIVLSLELIFTFGSVWCACHNHSYPNAINSIASFSKISCLAFLDVWDGDLYFVDGPHIANIVYPRLRKKALICYDALLLVPQEANQPAFQPIKWRHVVEAKSHQGQDKSVLRNEMEAEFPHGRTTTRDTVKPHAT